MPNTILSLDTIHPKPLHWLWRPRIPLGRLTILLGHPDRGKTLVACTFAFHVTRGVAWPDGLSCRMGNVLFLESEDSLEETTVPRLIASGCDMSRVFSRSERDLNGLESIIKEKAIVLVVISPLNTYLPQTNTRDDQKIRKILQPIADIAERTGASIVVIMHPPKTRHTLPIHSVAGSTAYGAVARSVLVTDRDENGLCLLESIKGNLSGLVPPIGYRILSWNQDEDVAVLKWELVEKGKSNILPPHEEEKTALDEACEFLQMKLEHGPVSAATLKEMADTEGVSWRSVVRARKLLRTSKRKVGSGVQSYWEVYLNNAKSTV